jgi:sulfatase maturation enzyme AslB (radical SAM superfamily)
MEYTYEELKDVVDEVVTDCPSQVIFEFFGGEPFLRFDTVKQIFAYIEATYPEKVQYFKIFTNTTLISDDILEFFKQNARRWCIRFSLNDDGENTGGVMLTHGTSVAAMVDNIKQFIATGASCEVHCGAYPDNVARVAKAVEFLYGIGLRIIRVGILHYPSTFDAAYAATLRKEMLKVGDFARSHADLNITNFTEGWDYGRRGPFLFQKINGEYVDDLESASYHADMIQLYRDIYNDFHFNGRSND